MARSPRLLQEIDISSNNLTGDLSTLGKLLYITRFKYDSRPKLELTDSLFLVTSCAFNLPYRPCHIIDPGK